MKKLLLGFSYSFIFCSIGVVTISESRSDIAEQIRILQVPEFGVINPPVPRYKKYSLLDSPAPQAGCPKNESDFYKSLRKFVDFNCNSISTSIYDEDVAALDAMATDQLIRDTVSIEMNKYLREDAFRMRTMVEDLKRTSKDQIHSCGKVYNNLSDNRCVENDNLDVMVKNYFANHRSDELMSFASNGKKSGRRQSEYFQTELGNKGYKNDAVEAFMTIRKVITRKASNDAHDAKVLDLENENFSGIKEVDLKDHIKKLILEAAKNPHATDPVFTYSPERLDKLLEKYLDVNPKDLIVDSKTKKSNLSTKISKLRVKIANAFIDDDCHLMNLTIEQACGQISEKITPGEIIKKILNKEQYLGKISSRLDEKIQQYSDEMSENGKSKIPGEKIKQHKALIERILADKDNKTFYKYVDYLERKKSCKGDITISSEELARASKESEEYRHGRASETIGYIRDNKDLQKNIKSMGYELGDDILSSGSEIAGKKDAVSSSVAPKQEDKLFGSAGGVISAPDKPTPSSQAITSRKDSQFYDPSSETEAEAEAGGKSFGKQSAVKTSVSENEAKLNTEIDKLKEKAAALSEQLNNVSADKKAASEEEIQVLKDQIAKLQSEKALVAKKDKSSSNDGESYRGEIDNNFSAKAPSVGRSSNNFDASPASGARKAQAISGNFDNVPTEVSPSSTSHSSTSSGVAKPTDMAKSTVPASTLVLKSGEVVNIPSNIPNNPGETEILKLIDAENGKPILIMENGVLKTAYIKIGSDGQRIIEKKPLPKLEQKKVSNQIESLRSTKEVEGRVPAARLIELRNLFNK